MTASASAQNCPRCGSPIQAGTEGLCAACLMLRAIADTETEIIEQRESPRTSPLPSLPEPNELPCAFGGYRLLRLLGSGGMGTVYEAEQASTGRRVALKMLSQQLESADMRGRFYREGRLAAGISHPNSLYVFGTEEIEGIPVITMEIADSGTLADQLEKRGPLQVADAVDVVLGLITGLEAAHAAGVLHRDVKPSNVFVNPDGSVKVGDYGLSVSTMASVDSFATATGVVMGTPAYAAPEQLRGDELDVRADIYSVGATLFTLLTDRAPIEGRNPVQFVAAALDEKPKLLTAVRNDVPPGLAQIVARCLAKKPQHRPADYAELRSALLPFSSETPQPAPLPRRVLGYLVDELLSWFIPGLLVTSSLGVDSIVELLPTRRFWPCFLGLGVWYVGYYTLPEGRWGAGIGKWLTHIRVARTDGPPPGYLKAFLRAVIGWVARQGMPVLALAGIVSTSSMVANAILYTGFHWCVMLAPLITMRRRNGFAMLWDILTDTRVVEKPKEIARTTIDVETQIESPLEDANFIGPYAIVAQIAPGWMAGIDPALHRQVWMRRRTVKLDISRRDVARPGRSRWQQSIKMPETTWDVFEAAPGTPLSSLLGRATRSHRQVHWEAVRHWLYDLVIELAQASEDGTLPNELGLDHVWTTGSGHAILLDEPWPKTDVSADLIDVSDVAGRQRFIDKVAKCADPTTIPLHARPVLRNLATGSFDRLSFLAGNLRSLLNKPARLDSTGRAASLFAIPVVLIAMAVFHSLFAVPTSNQVRRESWEESYPGLPVLSEVLRYRDSLDKEGSRHNDFIDVHVAGHYRYTDFADISDYSRYRLLSDHERNILRQAVDSAPEFTPAQLLEADRSLSGALAAFRLAERQTTFQAGVRSLVGLVFLIAVLQLAVLTLVGATVGQYLFGFAVVNVRGESAGRLRLLLRWLIAWSLPFLAFPIGAAIGGLSLLLLLPWIIGLAVAVKRPSRGVHDQLSGSWLVPR